LFGRPIKRRIKTIDYIVDLGFACVVCLFVLKRQKVEGQNNPQNLPYKLQKIINNQKFIGNFLIMIKKIVLN